MAPRIAKTAMTGCLAAFALLVAFNNITDYGANFAFVRHVMSMDTIFPGQALGYRAVASPLLWNLSYLLIIAAEASTGLVLSAGTISMLRALRAGPATFAQAKRLVHLGVMLGFLLWFGGFLVVGGEWFVMWQSRIWNGQEPAFRFFLTMVAVLVYVAQPEDPSAGPGRLPGGKGVAHDALHPAGEEP